MRKVLVGIAVLGILAAACGSEGTTIVRERTITVTESASPTVEATTTAAPVIETTATRGDARACELVRLAETREANSPSWIDILGDAGFKASDYDLQDAIDKAYWTSGDALAAERVADAEAICDGLAV